ncbi:MAG: DUF433 domain-containing protein [Pirellulales bacterium]|nr:DUF433 domain-containing protein [Pirellulales bacterium]
MSLGASEIITVDPAILGGTPVFCGTRVPVDTLVSHLRAGDTIETFLEDFPGVSRSQIQAYLELSEKLVLESAVGAHPTR